MKFLRPTFFAALALTTGLFAEMAAAASLPVPVLSQRFRFPRLAENTPFWVESPVTLTATFAVAQSLPTVRNISGGRVEKKLAAPKVTRFGNGELLDLIAAEGALGQVLPSDRFTLTARYAPNASGTAYELRFMVKRNNGLGRIDITDYLSVTLDTALPQLTYNDFGSETISGSGILRNRGVLNLASQLLPEVVRFSGTTGGAMKVSVVRSGDLVGGRYYYPAVTGVPLFTAQSVANTADGVVFADVKIQFGAFRLVANPSYEVPEGM
jgi:hypothetical protein